MSNAKEGRKELDGGELVNTGHWYNFILLQANLLLLLGSLILGEWNQIQVKTTPAVFVFALLCIAIANSSHLLCANSPDLET